MKTILKLCCILFLSFSLSCTKDLTSLNIDTKNATTAAGQTFFSNAQKNLSDEIGSTAYTSSGTGVAKLFAQLLTSVTYLEGVTYIKNFSWDGLYSILKDLDESAKVISSSEPTIVSEQVKKKNQLAIIEIMKVYTYSILVESYGDIPYSEALDFNNVLPKFDDDKVIYVDLITRLTSATSNLDPTGTSFGAADLIYAGNVAKWVKFGNSLKLRMGLRIIDAEPAIGASTVTSAVTGGVFTSNADNALFTYLPDFPNTNPWWNHLVRGNLRYFVGTTPLVNYMNTFNDPRRAAYFTSVGGQYIGAESGKVSDYLAFSYLGARFFQPTLKNIIFDYSSVEFLLAEAAERGISGVSTAQSHYNAAITASFDYYKVTGAVDYLAQPAVNYATAEGPWQKKIGVQKWIALFEQGFEAWTEYRRLDYPVLQAPAAADSKIVPLRFIYPISEQTINGINYQSAASAIGGDEYTTHLFWDVH